MDHKVNVILRRDSLVDSVENSYKIRNFPDDLDESTISSAVRRPIALPFNPDRQQSNQTLHTISAKTQSTAVAKNEAMSRSTNWKYIASFVMLSCLFATGVCMVIYVQPYASLDKMPFFFSNNNIEIDRELNYEDLYPESYSVFASNSDERSIDEVPVFLDLTGIESEFVSSALTNCLNLTKTSVYSKDKKQQVLERQTDFIHTDSLCAISNNFNPNKKARVFILARSPSSRSVLSYREKQDMAGFLFDERTLGLDFLNYLESPLLEKDSLTRAILCKENAELRNEDYAAAKYFLENYVTYDLFKYYRRGFAKFAQMFGWKFSSYTTKKCVDDIFQQGSKQTERLLHGMRMLELYKLAANVNRYDTMLYTHIASTS